MPKTKLQVSFFSALCLFLSAVEYAIPKPLPFMRLGLANLPIVLALPIFSTCDILLLIILKILGQALISGTLFSYVFLFSASGSLASGISMLLLYLLFAKRNLISNFGLCLAGSLANNAAQLFVSRFVIFGENARYIAPLLFTSGIISASVLGFFSNTFSKKSEWYINLCSTGDFSLFKNDYRFKNDYQNQIVDNTGNKNEETKYNDTTSENLSKKAEHISFILAMILFPFFLLQDFFLPKSLSLLYKTFISWLCIFIFYIMLCVKKRRLAKILPSIFITLGITFFSLLNPSGKVLYSLGKFRITQDALLLALRKSATLVGMVFLSQFAISPRLSLPGKVGTFLKDVFTYFDALTSNRVKFSKGNIIKNLDEHLYKVIQHS